MKSTYTIFLLALAVSLSGLQSCASGASKATNGSDTAKNRDLKKPVKGSKKGLTEKLPTKGCVADDCTNGKGTYIFESGAKYVGQFKDGLPHGDGVMTYPNGDVYTGPFRKGKRAGYGTYVFHNGDKYIGEFLDGEMKGLGNYVWKDGSVLKGEFKENGSDGGGIFLKPGQTLQDKGKNCDIEKRNITCRN